MPRNRGGDDYKRKIFSSLDLYNVSTRGKYRRILGAGVNLSPVGFEVTNADADLKPTVFMLLALKVHR